MYHLESTKYGHQIVLKTSTENRENPELDSVVDLFKGAELNENEIFDLFGIVFRGHPNLRRMFMPEDWNGFPLRKDYVDEINAKPGEYSFCIGYGYDYEEAVKFREMLKDLVKERLGIEEIEIHQIGATIGVHTGPYPIGVGIIKKAEINN